VQKKQCGKVILGGLLLSFGQHSYAAGTLEITDAKELYQIDQKNHNYNIGAGSLAQVLNQYAQKAGVALVFDPLVTQGKSSKGLNGQYAVMAGFKTILQDTGLTVINDDQGKFKLVNTAQVQAKEKNIDLEEIQVRAKRFYEIGPLPGLGLTKDQIPGNVQSISAKEIKEAHSLSISDLLNKKLQSVTVNDYQGNPFQMDVQYRGFTAGPQIGTPQGLSVFFDGIRVNEPFGDVVNWDMIPMNALASVDVFPGSNPIFGLNTLGGAFTVKTKDGFNNEGADVDVLTGSYGRKQLQVEGGINNGTFALFGAGNFFLEDGWRDNSPSKVNQFFGKASYRGDKLDLNLSTLIVGTDLVGNGLLPSEMFAQDRNASFTSEDKTKNRLKQFQLSGAFQATDTFSVTGQVYRRDSVRKQKGADAITEWGENMVARRLPTASEEHTCVFLDSKKQGIPDYLVVSANRTQGEDFFSTKLWNDFYANNGVIDFENENADYSANSLKYADFINIELPKEMQEGLRGGFNFYKDFNTQIQNQNGIQGNGTKFGPPIDINELGNIFQDNAYEAGGVFGGNSGSGGSGGFSSINQNFAGENIVLNSMFYTHYYTKNQQGEDIKNFVVFLPPINRDKCLLETGQGPGFPPPYLIREPNNPQVLSYLDGGQYGQPGWVKGTPTAIITDNQIDQIVDGFSIQFNWNLEKHKFMVGASLDSASAEYGNSQQLGFLNGERDAYLDEAQAHPQFLAAFVPVRNNDFSGKNITKSIYFSDTWAPVETLNLNISGRYNDTQAKNKIAARYGSFNYTPTELINLPFDFDLCTDVNGDCKTVPRNFRRPRLTDTLDKPETEKFSYYSFNPSIGLTWQAKENLNLYGNIAKGARTPSVIELGCALDKTPSYFGPGNPTPEQLADPKNYIPKSIAENRACSLPTTLSGDPYLPQIKATTYDIGMRGNIGESLQWNLGAYQTDLKDDIYFITAGNGQGFFDTVGKTRRRGVEAGFSGKKDKWGFSVNYSLTDATFQDGFRMISNDNSSAVDRQDGFGYTIDVKPGSRIPGVALHNLNASISYDVTDKWSVGLTAIAHAESFVRGNENNKHKKGVIQRSFIYNRYVDDGTGNLVAIPTTVTTQPTNNPGKVPGYATFNFQTRYKFNSEWSASMQVNNLFDKEYFTAGRLGRNPFSPSILGAIGPDGYNHNSFDWLSTNFIAPSAPRGVWFSLNWHFDPKKPY
jgi:Fe(3+) dicitrate transport protein